MKGSYLSICKDHTQILHIVMLVIYELKSEMEGSLTPHNTYTGASSINLWDKRNESQCVKRIVNNSHALIM